ncbi:MAG: hypothetical protein Q8O83_00300 [bacterium]|nr:hypothetical protein [bacterium]
MALSWRAQRQLTYFGIFSTIIFLIVFLLIFFFQPAPTCFDRIQNQEEEGIDCGGPCEKGCLGDIKNVVVLWNRVFEVIPSHYDVAVLVENPNLFAGAPIVHYQIKLHDDKNVLVALRGGTTFINPQERFMIFESNIQTANRVPVQASIEFERIPWERIEEEKPQVTAFNFRMTQFPTGRLDITLRNGNFLPAEQIETAVALLDENGNAFAVSKTRVESIQAESSRDISFTWPFLFEQEPKTIQTFIRKIPQKFLHSEI